jgi:putative transposase
VGKSWRVDETYTKIKGKWKYLYRAVDKAGQTVDFLLRAQRDKAAAQRYFEKSIDQNGEPETITIDKSSANLAALEALNAERDTPIKIGQNKYLNNIIEQDHRAIKRRTRPMLGFKTFRCARILLGGIDAHDQEGAVERQGKRPDSCRSVLCVDKISIPYHFKFFSPGYPYCDRTCFLA